MNYTEREVLQYIEENDVKFVKLTFCDIYGNMKNISILSTELAAAFSDGIYITAKKITGFAELSDEDLMLFPDPSTMTVLPWRPQQGRVVRFFCYIRHRDGRQFEGDSRWFLKTAVEKAKAKGYTFQIGTSCEFYLFKTTEEGIPTKVPHDFGGYADVSPSDKGENVRREVCLTLEQMDIQPVSSRHESGPGQHEIDFKYSSALNAADTFLSFRSTVKAIAERNGLYASFMPKPLIRNGGSGLHININAARNGVNVFSLDGNGFSQEAKSFAAGIMKYIKEMTVFTNSIANSYRRLGEYSAPKYITWAHSDFSQLLRIPLDNRKEGQMILRSPDCACNPYYVIGLLMYACMEGAENKLELCDEVSLNPMNASDEQLRSLEVLPADLGEAVECAKNSDFLKKYLPARVFDFVINERSQAWVEYQGEDNKELYEERKYFYSM